MLNIPDSVKELLNDDKTVKNFRVHFPNGEMDDITNENIVSESLSFNESICSQSELKFGLCESPSIEFETYGIGKCKGAEIECSIEVGEHFVDEKKVMFGDSEVDLFNYLGVDTKQFRETTLYVEFDNAMSEVITSVTLKNDISGGNVAFEKVNEHTWSVDWRSDYSGYSTSFGLTLPPYGLYVTLSTSATAFGFISIHQSYSIPLGTFVIDSCKKQADMTHRKIVAYAITSDYSLNNFERFTNVLKNAFYWSKSNLAVSISALVKLLTITDESLEEKTYTTSSCVRKFKNSKVTQYYKIYSYSDYSKENFVYAKYKYSKQFTEKSNEIYNTYIKPVNQSIKAFDKIAYSNHALIYDSSSGSYEEKTRSLGTEFINDGYLVISPFRYLLDDLGESSYRYYAFSGLNMNGSGKVGGCMITTRIVVSDADTDEILFDTGDYSTENKIISYNSDPFLVDKTSSLCLLPKTTSKSVKLYGESNTVTKTLYLYDFSEIFKLDMRAIAESFCELQGKFGKTSRNGSFELFSPKDKFTALYPSETLYPSDTLYPNQNVGDVFAKSNYQTVWYDDDYTLPFGSVSCTYNNGTDNVYIKVYADGYSDETDINSYQNYDVSDNEIIKISVYTETQIKTILETIAENISGISFMPAEITMQGRPDIECGDVLEIATTDEYITTLVMQRSMNGIQNLVDSIRST